MEYPTDPTDSEWEFFKCADYTIIDSQSVKTTSASEERGIDGGKIRTTSTLTIQENAALHNQMTES